MVSLDTSQSIIRDSQPRRATVSSPSPPSFTFIDSSSRRYEPYHSHPHPHPRRQTYSGSRPHPHSPSLSHESSFPFAAHSTFGRGFSWNDSATPSPMMTTTLLPSGPESSPSSSNSFEYVHNDFGSALALPNHAIPRSTGAMDGIEDSPPFTGYGSPLPQHASYSASSVSETPPPDEMSLEEARVAVVQLRDRVRDLEFISDLARLRAAELEAGRRPPHTLSNNEVDHEVSDPYTPTQPRSTNPDHPFQVYDPSLPNSPPYNPHLGAPPPDWNLRTLARTKRFCALNRAGNALCAWHDSRRERRAFPPRMAPTETLNCGCSYREALFEESLARNGVGAFWPGESVRMDPVLRNGLLRLLEERYGYKDGDFERTADGGWKEGEDARSWEQKAQRPTRRER